jgi:hypothetical protein
MKMLRHSWIVALILIGCGAPKASPFLADAPPLKRGEAIKGYGSTGTLSRQLIARVYVDTVDVAQIANQPKYQRMAADEFRASAVKTIYHADGWGITDFPQQCSSRLMLAVTKLDPGSGAGRIFAGELGMGNASIHMEAKLIDAATGKPVAAFASDMTDSGNAGIDDMGPNGTERILKRLFDRFNEDIVKQVNEDLRQHSQAK